MSKKKCIGKFLETKRSWKKVVGYLKKRLLKSIPWDFTYEFDEGKIRVQIIPIGYKHHKEPIAPATGDIKLSRKEKRRLRKLKRKKQWS